MQMHFTAVRSLVAEAYFELRLYLSIEGNSGSKLSVSITWSVNILPRISKSDPVVKQ